MKKVVALICLLALLMSAMTVAVFASPKDDILFAADNSGASPKIIADYRPQAVAILNQVDVNDIQATLMIDLINEVTVTVPLTKDSLHEYTDDEQNYLADAFDRACAILNLTFEIVEKGDGFHGGDYIYKVYNSEGKLVGELDGDWVNQTGGNETDTTRNLTIVVLALAVLTAASVAYAAKKTAQER